MKQISLHGGQEAERAKEKDQEQDNTLKGIPSASYFL